MAGSLAPLGERALCLLTPILAAKGKAFLRTFSAYDIGSSNPFGATKLEVLRNITWVGADVELELVRISLNLNSDFGDSERLVGAQATPDVAMIASLSFAVGGDSFCSCYTSRVPCLSDRPSHWQTRSTRGAVQTRGNSRSSRLESRASLRPGPLPVPLRIVTLT